MPDSFWDSEKNEIKLPDLIKEHGTLSQFKTETEARFKERPESPDKYELRIPEDVKMPEGVTFELQPDSPLTKLARQIAFDSGRGQKGFDEMVSMFIQHEVALANEEATHTEETYQAERSKLGEKANDRIQAADAFLKKNLSENQYQALLPVTATAEGVRALEALMALTKDSTPRGTGEGERVGDAASQKELDDLMASPKYWRDRDPETVEKVRKGYQKLYPGQISGSSRVVMTQ